MNSLEDAGIDVKISARSFLKSLGYSDERVNLAVRLLQTDACVVSRKALKIIPTGYGCAVEAHPKNVARWNPELRAAIRDAAKEQRALKWAEQEAAGVTDSELMLEIRKSLHARQRLVKQGLVEARTLHNATDLSIYSELMKRISN